MSDKIKWSVTDTHGFHLALCETPEDAKKLQEIINSADYWKRRYEVAREVAIELEEGIMHGFDCEENYCIKKIDEEIERRVKGNK